MNRRDFNTTLLGGAAFSTLPAASLGATANAVSRDPLLAWATAIANAQNRASPALLARQLSVPIETAQTLYATLINDAIIRAPAAGGIAKAANPIRMSLTKSTHNLGKPLLKTAQGALDRQTPVSSASSCQKTLGEAETEKSLQDFSHRADTVCAKPDGASGPAHATPD